MFFFQLERNELNLINGKCIQYAFVLNRIFTVFGDIFHNPIYQHKSFPSFAKKINAWLISIIMFHFIKYMIYVIYHIVWFYQLEKTFFVSVVFSTPYELATTKSYHMQIYPKYFLYFSMICFCNFNLPSFI